jgi:hypothetical protein
MVTMDGGAKWQVLSGKEGYLDIDALSCSPGTRDCAVLGVPSVSVGKVPTMGSLSTTNLLHWQESSLPARPTTKNADFDTFLSCAGRGQCVGLETEDLSLSSGTFKWTALHTSDNGLMWTEEGSFES